MLQGLSSEKPDWRITACRLARWRPIYCALYMFPAAQRRAAFPYVGFSSSDPTFPLNRTHPLSKVRALAAVAFFLLVLAMQQLL